MAGCNRKSSFPVLFCVAVLNTGIVFADELRDFVEARMKEQHLPGLSMAVIRNGKIVDARGFGIANLETSTSTSPESVFELASLSKPFTASAILMLAQEQKLSLDDPVSRFIPQVPAHWGRVTISHLLSHTSGIEDPIDSVADPLKDRTPVEMLDMITHGGARFRPGEEWAYNNSGYYLLGVVIEKITGQPLDAFLSERIFRPQGMKQTRGNDLSEVIPNRVSGYHWRDGRYRSVRPVSPTLIKGAGHIISTVSDLARWDAALHNQSLLRKPLRDQLWTPARLNNQQNVTFNLPVEVLKGASYGYGWITGDMRGHRYAAHGGISPSGFTTFMLRFVDDHVTVIVLTNRSDVEDPWRPGAPRPEDIAMAVAGRYIKDLKE